MEWTRKAVGPRIDILRIKPQTYRVHLDGKPLTATYNHSKTAYTVALALVEAIREIG